MSIVSRYKRLFSVSRFCPGTIRTLLFPKNPHIIYIIYRDIPKQTYRIVTSSHIIHRKLFLPDLVNQIPVKRILSCRHEQSGRGGSENGKKNPLPQRFFFCRRKVLSYCPIVPAGSISRVCRTSVNARVIRSVRISCSSSVRAYDVRITIVPTTAQEPVYSRVLSNCAR